MADDDGALLQWLSLFLFCGPVNSPVLMACPVLSSHSVMAGCDLSEVAPSTGFTFFFFILRMQVEVRARSQAHVSHISRGGINAVVVNKVKRHFKGKLKLCCGMWIIIREANNSKRVCSQQGPHTLRTAFGTYMLFLSQFPPHFYYMFACSRLSSIVRCGRVAKEACSVLVARDEVRRVPGACVKVGFTVIL